MTFATPCTNTHPSAADAVRTRCASVAARGLAWLADRLETAAIVRQRRRAQRKAEQELQSLPEPALNDLGVGRGDVGPLIQGLVGPPAYWQGHTRRR